MHDDTPLFYGLLLAWTCVFGASAFALRALSLGAFAGTIAFSAAAAARVASPRAAWLTAIFVGCSVPFGLQPAATARPYALAALSSAMTLWFALRIDASSPRVRAAAPLVASHLLGLFTHPVFLFVSAASSIAGVIWGRRRRLLFAAPAAAVAVYLATWWPMIRQTAELPARTWMAQPAFGDLTAGTLFWGDHGTPVVAVLVIVLMTARWVGHESSAWPAIAFPLTVAGLVLAGTFVVSHITPVYLPARTPIFVLPAAALAAGVVIADLAPGLVTAAVALMVATSAVRYSVRSWRQADPFPTRASLADVVSRARCGDAIVAAGLSYAPLTYYAAASGVPPCIAIVAFPDHVREHPGWLDLSTTARAALPALAAAGGARLPGTATIWVFTPTRGVGEAEAATLVQELTARRHPPETLVLSGSFFDEVKVFRIKRTR